MAPVPNQDWTLAHWRLTQRFHNPYWGSTVAFELCWRTWMRTGGLDRAWVND